MITSSAPPTLPAPPKLPRLPRPSLIETVRLPPSGRPKRRAAPKPGIVIAKLADGTLRATGPELGDVALWLPGVPLAEGNFAAGASASFRAELRAMIRELEVDR